MARLSAKDFDIIKDRELDAAVAACREQGFLTFSLIWEDGRKVTAYSYPDTPGVIKGLCDRILFVLTGKFF